MNVKTEIHLSLLSQVSLLAELFTGNIQQRQISTLRFPTLISTLYFAIYIKSLSNLMCSWKSKSYILYHRVSLDNNKKGVLLLTLIGHNTVFIMSSL